MIKVVVKDLKALTPIEAAMIASADYEAALHKIQDHYTDIKPKGVVEDVFPVSESYLARIK